jgi:hypothetical protein
MPEEQEVDADHDGYQREYIEHAACPPSHRFTLLLEDRVAVMDDCLAALCPALRATSRAAPGDRSGTPRLQSGRLPQQLEHGGDFGALCASAGLGPTRPDLRRTVRCGSDRPAAGKTL